jgi:hypothetical protein
MNDEMPVKANMTTVTVNGLVYTVKKHVVEDIMRLVAPYGGNARVEQPEAPESDLGGRSADEAALKKQLADTKEKLDTQKAAALNWKNKYQELAGEHGSPEDHRRLVELIHGKPEGESEPSENHGQGEGAPAEPPEHPQGAEAPPGNGSGEPPSEN